MARELQLSIPMSGIRSGATYKHLKEYLGAIECFPLVDKLSLTITDSTAKAVDSTSDAVSNALTFAQYLKSLVPIATTTEVGFNNPSANPNEYDQKVLEILDEEMFGHFARSLYDSIKCAMFNSGDIILRHSATVDSIPQLTRLKVNCSTSPELHASLATKSADILCHLDISIPNASALLHNPSGDTVTYSKLQQLRLHVHVRSGLDAGTSEIVQFPVLEKLILTSQYPFSDDVLFRGNGSTLNHLDICIDNFAVDMLNARQVFENKHRTIRHVKVNESYVRDLYLVSLEDMGRFLHNLTSSAHSFSLSTSTISRMPILTGVKGGFKNIQEFGSWSDSWSFYDVLCLLKAFPAMTKFTGAIRSLGSELEGMDVEELSDHVVSTYSSVGKELQVWERDSFYSLTSADALVHVMLLALVCPRLHSITIDSHDIPAYNASIAKALEDGPFSKYASQLNRLIISA